MKAFAAATSFPGKAFLRLCPLFRGCADCPDRPPSLRQRLRGLPEPGFPVDVVYTWVDGRDPVWLAKRSSRGLGAEDANHYRDNGELRYSLRSLERFAPWVRRVHIVTDGQIPSWLNAGHEKLRLVAHRDIIPARFLPTFSSRVIEAHLHRIEGLAEHYVYFNDDFFLISPCFPGDFFTANGLPFLFADWRESRRAGYAREDTPHAASWAAARDFLAANGVAPAPEVIAAHAPYPQSRSNAAGAYAFFEDAVNTFQPARAPGDIAFYCHGIPLWAYARRATVPCDVAWYYINAKRLDRRLCYAAISREKSLGTLPLFLCLNDVGEAPSGNAWHADMQTFLSGFYPDKSAFERS
ncbi:MAG: Stealth CR1 domain-containing protein [Desulfovibrio sp.]|jgi:hypothetical protein|nr:Stealth CR1 domain-containing protein [Desulfovibrio sp.]